MTETAQAAGVDRPTGASAPPTPSELLRSRPYLVLLVVAAILGAPIAAFAYFFLKLVAEAQQYVYETLPGELGFSHEPLWWPLPLLILCGLDRKSTRLNSSH